MDQIKGMLKEVVIKLLLGNRIHYLNGMKASLAFLLSLFKIYLC